jgi:hypothetical protein
MFTFVRNMLRDRALTSYVDAEREYRKARKRLRRAEKQRDLSTSSSPLSGADALVLELALACALRSAERLLEARTRCESLREPRPVAALRSPAEGCR